MENEMRPLAWVPNIEGFELTVYARDGQKLNAAVKRHPDTKLHYLDFIGPYRYQDLLGWTPGHFG